MAAKTVKSPEGMIYEQQMKRAGLFILRMGRLRGANTAVYNFLTRGNREGDAEFFLVFRDKMQGNGLRLHKGKMRL